MKFLSCFAPKHGEGFVNKTLTLHRPSIVLRMMDEIENFVEFLLLSRSLREHVCGDVIFATQICRRMFSHPCSLLKHFSQDSWKNVCSAVQQCPSHELLSGHAGVEKYSCETGLANQG